MDIGEEKMKYICIKQHDSKDCGVACLSSICTYYGLKLPLIKYKELSKSDNMGTNIFGLIEAGKQLGFETDALNGSFEELKEEIEKQNISLPFIAHVIINNNFEHFVVVYKITKDKITLADPAVGMVTKSIEEFLKEWTGNIISYKKTEKFVAEKKKLGLVSFFIKNIPHKKKMISIILLFSALSSLIGIVTSLIYSMLIDGVVLRNYSSMPESLIDQVLVLKPITVLMIIIGTGIVLQFLKVMFDILRGKLVAKLSVIFDTSIIEKYYDHLLNLPISFFSTKKTGELISRFNDAIKIRTAIMSLLLSVTLDLTMVLCGGFLMFKLSPQLFLLSLILASTFLLVMYFFKERIQDLEQKMMHSNGLVTSYLKETISGVETIKTFQLEETVFSAFKNLWTKNQEIGYKGSITDNTRFSLVNFISSTGLLCIYFLGVREILNSNLSIGILISYGTLTTYFLSPFTNIVNLQTEVQSATVALDRLGDILFAELEEKQVETELPHLLEDIYFDKVSFRYGNRQPVLNEISFRIPKKQRVSIIGESGSGKTTIIQLLLRLFEKESGNITIGHKEIEDISIKDLRSKIATVSQTSFFFNETIMNNLKKGNADMTDDEIISTCQECGIHPFIMRLPMKYNSILEEGGNNLSGGQRQLLSIARALVKKPDILILDEATSNLDSHSEELIEKVVSKLNITCITIAHRLKTVINSNQIIILKEGRIRGVGTHEELLKSSTLYNEMLDKQRIV